MLNSVSEKLKNIDVFRSTQDDFKVKTFSGAIISILSISIMVMLFLSELFAAVRVDMNEQLVVDDTLDQPLDIFVDVVFDHVPCFLLSVGARDALGDDRRDITTDISKRSLDINGNPIGEIVADELIHTAATKEELLSQNNNTTCYSCFGAEDQVQPDKDGRRCCNTCEALLEAYNKKMWSKETILRDAPICKDYDKFKDWKEGVEKGCQVTANIHVNKVAGHFFVAPSKLYSLLHEKNLDWNTMHTVTNISHHINTVRFGNDFTNTRANSITNRTYVMPKETGMYQYFVKVVPTTYKTNKGQVIADTYQISETHNFREMTDKSMYLFPGLFFVYDISPLRSIITYDHQPVGTFLTSICAILGGVYTIMGLIDSLVYSVEKKMSKKPVLETHKGTALPPAKRD